MSNLTVVFSLSAKSLGACVCVGGDIRARRCMGQPLPDVTVFYIRPAEGVGWYYDTPRRFVPNWAGASREKNEHVVGYKTQRTVSKFKVSGQPVTSGQVNDQVRSGFGFGSNSQSGRRAKVQVPTIVNLSFKHVG